MLDLRHGLRIVLLSLLAVLLELERAHVLELREGLGGSADGIRQQRYHHGQSGQLHLFHRVVLFLKFFPAFRSPRYARRSGNGIVGVQARGLEGGGD
jgi:hypothetical protein